MSQEILKALSDSEFIEQAGEQLRIVYEVATAAQEVGVPLDEEFIRKVVEANPEMTSDIVRDLVEVHILLTSVE